MKISKPIELDAGPYKLRLDGSILTMSKRISSPQYQEPTTYEWTEEVEESASHSMSDMNLNPWAVIADLMRKLAEAK